jgi:hypothetical protein
MQRWIGLVGALVGFVVVVSGAAAQTEPPTEAVSQVRISAPVEGATISGTVQIVGTTVHPDFQAFTVAYSVEPPVGPNPWTPLQPPVAQQVTNSTLAIWDTTTVPDNRYVLRLQVETSAAGGEPITAFVTVNVSNATPTPLPTIFIPTAAPPADATAGPSPSPFIDMPPTRTPRPTETPGGPTPTPDAAVVSPLEPTRLREAALRGAVISLAAFGVIGLYVTLRGGLRDRLRIIGYDIRQWFRRFGKR